MSPAGGRMRRILLALDASPECRAAVESAAEWAEALHAEIAGLFVEDLELLDLAAHPMARRFDPFTGRLQPLETGALERRLRVQAARARALLARSADLRGVAWSFRVERGAVVERIRHASAEADVVTVGRVGWSARRTGLGSTAAALLEEGPTALLVEGGRPAPDAPVAVVVDGSETGRAALDLAADLAERRERSLEVLLLARPDAPAPTADDVEDVLATRPAAWRARVHLHPVPDADALVAWLETRPCALVVLPNPADAGERRPLSLVPRLGCSVLVVRRGAAASPATGASEGDA